MPSPRRIAPSLLALAALSACDSAPPQPCGDGSCGSQVSVKATFQLAIDNRKLDLLVIVDDTSAIAPYADAVRAGLAAMGRRFPSEPGPEISLHAGFIRAGTCDASTRGATCAIAAPDQFVRSEWCNTVTNFNYGGGLADAFSCMGDFGAANCGPAQPLATAVGWLASPLRPGWEGFLRPEASLMVIVIAATDDASGAPVQTFVSALKALKPDPSQVLATVVGPASGCTSDDLPDPRLYEFVNSFGANGLHIPLCAHDLGVVLDRIFIVIGDRAPPCLRGARDMDPATPGVQASCVAERHSLRSDGSIEHAALPSCDDSPPPCLQLSPGDGALCDGLFASYMVAPDWCAASPINFTVECLACADANDPACAPAR